MCVCDCVWFLVVYLTILIMYSWQWNLSRSGSAQIDTVWSHSLAHLFLTVAFNLSLFVLRSYYSLIICFVYVLACMHQYTVLNHTCYVHTTHLQIYHPFNCFLYIWKWRDWHLFFSFILLLCGRSYLLVNVELFLIWLLTIKN